VLLLPPVADAGKFFGRIRRRVPRLCGARVERRPPTRTDATSERWIENGHESTARVVIKALYQCALTELVRIVG
jgi:hypothetical protein